MSSLVDAEPVRQHVLALQARSMSYKQTATAAGVAWQTVSYLLYGDKRQGKPPARRVHVMNAKRLLAVRFDLAHFGDMSLIDATGTRRRLRALVVSGWSNRDLADYLHGADESFVNALIRGYRKHVQVRTHREVVALHRDLWNVEPPQDTTAQRVRVLKAKNRARKYGYLPTLAWDDFDTDPEPVGAPKPGDAATYGATRARVNKTLGPAKHHACVDCAGDAVTWMYDGLDPHGLIDPKGRPYSLDLGRYVPRCHPCRLVAETDPADEVVDEVAVRRVVNGEAHPKTLRRAEKVAAARLYVARGMSPASAAERLNVSYTVVRQLLGEAA